MIEFWCTEVKQHLNEKNESVAFFSNENETVKTEPFHSSKLRNTKYTVSFFSPRVCSIGF